MRIVIAPNAFKGSLAAQNVADAIQEGILKAHPTFQTVCLPVGDGGDGTGALIRKYLNAVFVPQIVSDPLLRPVEAGFGLLENIAIIEMADACGIRLLPAVEYKPLVAQTKGVGELIKAALARGAKKILLGIGGSATVDGGCGMLRELGLRFFDKYHTEITEFPLGLAALHQIDLSGFDAGLRETEIVVLCDVDNKLLGSQGAAAVFAPQKGASDADVKFLEKALARLDEVVFETTSVKMSALVHSGAAGGVGAALAAFCNASLVNGIEYLIQLIDFEYYVKNADLVITGEGSIDSQTLLGKAPFGVAAVAKKFGLPVLALGGRVNREPDQNWEHVFDKVVCITPPDTPLHSAIQNTRENLVNAASKLL